MKKKITLTVAGLLLIAMLLVNLVVLVFWKSDTLQREAERDQMVLARILDRMPDERVNLQLFFHRLSFGDFYPSSEAGRIVLYLPKKGGDTVDVQSIRIPLLKTALAEAAAGRPVNLSSAFFSDLFQFRYPVLVTARPVVRQDRVIGAIAVIRSLEALLLKLWQAEKIILGYIILNLLVLSVIGFFRMAKLVVRPIERLVKLADRYHEQEVFLFAAEHSGSEFNRLSSSLNSMLGKIEQDRDSLQKTVAQLETANRQLKDRQQELIRAEKLASVGRMAAGLAHEIGNPLGVVQGYLGLLARSDEQNTEHQDFIRRAEQELQRVNNLVRQLLDFARMSKGRPGYFSLHTLLDSVAEIIPVQVVFMNINLTVKAEALQDTIYADQDQLRQVLINCLLNSADAINSSDQVGKGRITVTTSAKKSRFISVCITDNGIGMSEEQLALIFDPFYTTKEPGKGTGLGLSVSRSIIENAGGNMEIKSREGEGSTVSVLLPLADGGDRNE